MHPNFETIYIPRNTFGTKLQFTLFDENQNNESVSAYDQIKLRSFNKRGEEEFSGSVDETLSAMTTNVVHYTIADGDLKNRGLYDLYLELIKLSGSTIVYKNTVHSGRIKVE
jgi:hypothetical protein